MEKIFEESNINHIPVEIYSLGLSSGLHNLDHLASFTDHLSKYQD